MLDGAITIRAVPVGGTGKNSPMNTPASWPAAPMGCVHDQRGDMKKAPSTILATAGLTVGMLGFALPASAATAVTPNPIITPGGGFKTPPPGGGFKTPPPGGGTQTPPPGGGTKTPPPGGGTKTPPPGGGTQTPPPGGGTKTPPPDKGGSGGKGGFGGGKGGGQGGGSGKGG